MRTNWEMLSRQKANLRTSIVRSVLFGAHHNPAVVRTSPLK